MELACRRSAACSTELTQQKMLRAVYSERQLEEVLVDFWFNHFNVFAGKGQVRQYLTEYERDAIRPHVLGKFRDLLGATAQEPGDALLSRQLAERRSRSAEPATPTAAIGAARPSRVRTRPDGSAAPGRADARRRRPPTSSANRRRAASTRTTRAS